MLISAKKVLFWEISAIWIGIYTHYLVLDMFFIENEGRINRIVSWFYLYNLYLLAELNFLWSRTG